MTRGQGEWYHVATLCKMVPHYVQTLEHKGGRGGGGGYWKLEVY